MTVAAAVDPEGSLGHSWGKARSVVIGEVEDGQVVAWQPHDVSWDRVHDEGTSGAHHARVATFVRAHGVQLVLADHVGGGMRRMLGTMGVVLVEGVAGDARSAMIREARRWGPTSTQ